MSSVSTQTIGEKSKKLGERFPRRHYFINKPFQLVFAGNMLLITLIACAVTAGFVSWIHIYVLDDRLLVAGTMSGDYLLKIGFMLAGLAVGVLAWTILRTHAIAGPIYKTRKILQEAAEGRFPEHPVVFRRGDAFKELATDLNLCLRVMRSDRERLEWLGDHAADFGMPSVPKESE